MFLCLSSLSRVFDIPPQWPPIRIEGEGLSTGMLRLTDQGLISVFGALLLVRNFLVIFLQGFLCFWWS